MIKKIFLSLYLFLNLISTTSLAGPTVEISTFEDLQSYIKKSEFNGVVLVAEGEKILMKEAFGFKNLETKTPLSVTDKFLIGSVTKQFVAASLLKLQEEGRISLDDSVSKYVPQLEIYNNIKIRDILNHTSGITNFTDHKEFWEGIDYHKIYTLDEIIDFAIKFPLDFEPTSKWSYSNSGYILAGKIIEVVTGDGWDKYIEDKFLTPLEMNDTGYQEHFENISDVIGYLTAEDGSLVPRTDENTTWALSAGALYSTVDDLSKWTAIYGESNLLNQNSIRDMQMPFLDNYGLGIMILPYQDDLKITHGGRIPGFKSNLTYLKKSKLKVITLDNEDGKFRTIHNILLGFFTTGKTTVIKLDPYPITEEGLKEYTGTYSLGDFQIKVFLDKGKLFFQPNGQPPYEMKANDKDSFNLLDGFAGDEFIRDMEGKIIELKHYQDGNINSFQTTLELNQ